MYVNMDLRYNFPPPPLMDKDTDMQHMAHSYSEKEGR